MEQVNLRQARSWLPLLVFGYFESLRRSTFLAFGWVEHGITFIIVTLLVIFLAVTDMEPVNRVRLWVTRVITLLYIALIGYFAYLHEPGRKSFITGLLFGVPDFGQGALDSVEAATFSFFLIFGYGVLVFLISNFILEKQSYLEIFAASTMLLGVEIAVADHKLTAPVVVHVFFVLLLRNQLRLLEVACTGETVNAKNIRTVSSGWYIAGAAVALVGIGLALLLPAQDADLRGVWERLKPVNQARLVESPTGSDGEGDQRDSFYYFWDRLNDFELRGSLSLDNAPAMWVKAAKPFYWRGETADYYTGRGWRTTAEIEGENVSGKGLPNPYSKYADVRRVEQTFVLAPGMTSKVVFAANTPAVVEVPSGKFKWDGSGNVFTDYLQAGSTYRVVSYMPRFEPAILRKSSTSYPVDIRNKYLQLPENLPPRVKKKARSVTARQGNTYDKAKALERYLSTNFPYDLTVDATPKNMDVVDYFLFDLKKGYCTYHSTAMVVMLRSVGIPARWVKGYMTGSPDAATGVYEVTQADAHAWVEVYFSDFGWIPFEPTASFSLPETQAASVETEQLAEEAGPVGEIAETAELPPEEEEITARSMIFLAFFAIISGGVVLWFFFVRKKRFNAMEKHDQVRDVYLDLLALLQYLGFPRGETETPYEYARSLRDRLPAEHQDIMVITELYIRHQYGKTVITEADTEQAKAIWRRLSDKFLKKRKD